jgi:teichuronic acid biosynthesis glycosyltransferase TuaC
LLLRAKTSTAGDPPKYRMAKPRLLFISHSFPDTRAPYRGLDNANLLHHLAGQWDIAVMAIRSILPFGPKGWRARSVDDVFFPRFVPTHYLPKFGHGTNHRILAGSLRGWVGELRGAFQLALGAGIFPDSCALALLAEQFKFPFVAVAQGSDARKSLQIRQSRQVVSELMPLARGVITRSRELARVLAEAGLPKEKLHPIVNGIDFDRFHPGDIVAVRRELGLPANQRIVLFVGKFSAVKNPVLLVDAFDRVCSDKRFANALLVMIGGGPLEGEINFHVERGATVKRVLVSGRQNPDTVAKFLQAADVLCVSSNDEGVPNVILEAFACGVPVIATRVGGIPEVHTEDYLGCLVPPRDSKALAEALKLVLDSLPDRQRICDYARRFTWQHTAELYHAVLSAAVA